MRLIFGAVSKSVPAIHNTLAMTVFGWQKSRRLGRYLLKTLQSEECDIALFVYGGGDATLIFRFSKTS